MVVHSKHLADLYPELSRVSAQFHRGMQTLPASCRKYPELFGSFKTLLGFKDPGLPEQLPTNASLPPYPPKERVTEFAAEIGEEG